MFNGFPEDLIPFFLDLQMNNNATWFHEQHDRYRSSVVEPFYQLIDDLAPEMLRIDPRMEVRPHKALSHIHRDTRFSKDKSPYRTYLWFLFRRSGEPREGSINYYFQLGPGGMDYGLGLWDENKLLMEAFRRKLLAFPNGFDDVLNDCAYPAHGFQLQGQTWKRMSIPDDLPDRLRAWYPMRSFWLIKNNLPLSLAGDHQLAELIKQDFLTLAPLYHYFRGMADEEE